MKFILISMLMLFAGCSVKSAKQFTYSTLKSISKPKCEQMVYQGDRVNCVNNDRSNYNEYETYYNEKNR